jgi:hypothetical protein
MCTKFYGVAQTFVDDCVFVLIKILCVDRRRFQRLCGLAVNLESSSAQPLVISSSVKGKVKRAIRQASGESEGCFLIAF